MYSTSITILASICLQLLVTLPASVQAQCIESYEVFESSQPVSAEALAEYFGDVAFADIIREANAEIMNVSGLIPGGVQIQIPQNVATYLRNELPLDYVLNDPFCEPERNEDTMEAFRAAFEALVSNERQAANQQQESERQLIMEVDGFIYDETMSKIGRDFYDVFYTYWQSPQDAFNYSIVVSEQPAPGMGTIVSVMVNDQQTFTTRLQPRYDFIEEAGKQAVGITHNFLRNGQYQQQIY